MEQKIFEVFEWLNGCVRWIFNINQMLLNQTEEKLYLGQLCDIVKSWIVVQRVDIVP